MSGWVAGVQVDWQQELSDWRATPRQRMHRRPTRNTRAPPLKNSRNPRNEGAAQPDHDEVKLDGSMWLNTRLCVRISLSLFEDFRREIYQMCHMSKTYSKENLLLFLMISYLALYITFIWKMLFVTETWPAHWEHCGVQCPAQGHVGGRDRTTNPMINGHPTLQPLCTASSFVGPGYICWSDFILLFCDQGFCFSVHSIILPYTGSYTYEYHRKWCLHWYVSVLGLLLYQHLSCRDLSWVQPLKNNQSHWRAASVDNSFIICMSIKNLVPLNILIPQV